MTDKSANILLPQMKSDDGAKLAPASGRKIGHRSNTRSDIYRRQGDAISSASRASIERTTVDFAKALRRLADK